MMKKLSVLAIALLIATAAHAQPLPKFDAPMPSKPAVLKMRYDGLLKWADKHGNGMNEVQQDNLAGWYARIRNQATQPLLAKRGSLVAAMKAVSAWNDDYYTSLYGYMGGGTMYTHANNRSVADLADVEADAVAAWSKPARQQPDLAAVKPFAANNPTQPDSLSGEQLATYKKSLAQEAAALAKAKAAIAALPPGARAVVAKYVIRTANQKWGEGR